MLYAFVNIRKLYLTRIRIQELNLQHILLSLTRTNDKIYFKIYLL